MKTASQSSDAVKLRTDHTSARSFSELFYVAASRPAKSPRGVICRSDADGQAHGYACTDIAASLTVRFTDLGAPALTTALLRAVAHLVPDGGPLFPPGERPPARRAVLLRQVRFGDRFPLARFHDELAAAVRFFVLAVPVPRAVDRFFVAGFAAVAGASSSIAI